MAIFDGVGKLIQAPIDQGVYEKDNKETIVPLPLSIVLPKVRNEDPILPPDMEVVENSNNEIIDEGGKFPDSENNETIKPENVDLPIGETLPEIVDIVDVPEGVKVVEVSDDVILPDAVILPVIDDSNNSITPTGVIVDEVKDTDILLPESGSTKKVPSDFEEISMVSTPIDANTYDQSSMDDQTFVKGIVYSPSGVNWSNTIVDRLFTGINDVLDYVRIPVPESIKTIYSKIQEIEGYISDPRSFAIQLKEKAIGLLLGSNPEDRYDPKIGVVPLPKPAFEKLGSPNVIDIAKRDRALDMDERYGGGEIELTKGYVDKHVERQLEISDDILDSQFAFQGRKSTVGVTLRLNHLWDLKFEPYNADGIKCILPEMYVKVSTAYAINENNKSTEKYTERDSMGNPVRTNPEKDWEDSMPVLSYDLDYLSLASRDVELYGGSTISVPEIIKQNSLLTTQILDDENKRWRRWFQRALDAICSPRDGDSTPEPNSLVMPYKKCCMVATLYQYRTDSHILSHKKFIVLLKNYQVTSSGAGGGAGTPDIIDAEWSIVGEIKLHKSDLPKQHATRSKKRKEYPLLDSKDIIETEQTTITYINIV